MYNYTNLYNLRIQLWEGEKTLSLLFDNVVGYYCPARRVSECILNVVQSIFTISWRIPWLCMHLRLPGLEFRIMCLYGYNNHVYLPVYVQRLVLLVLAICFFKIYHIIFVLFPPFLFETNFLLRIDDKTNIVQPAKTWPNTTCPTYRLDTCDMDIKMVPQTLKAKTFYILQDHVLCISHM